MTMKVGRIAYLEYEPLYFDMARRGIAMSVMLPGQLATAVAAGAIDAGPVPLVDCFQLEDRLQPVSGFCLACAKRAGNLFLYAKQPIEQLTGARIGLPDEASTALRLLQVVLSLHYRVQPAAYVSLQEPYDAFSSWGTGLSGSEGAYGGTPTPMTWEKHGTAGPACPSCTRDGWPARIWPPATSRCWRMPCTWAWKMAWTPCTTRPSPGMTC